MADDLTAKLGELLKRNRGTNCRGCWPMCGSTAYRKELRAKNLHDTEDPPEPRQEIPSNLDPELRLGRTTDGTTTTSIFRRWDWPAVVSVGTFRWTRSRPTCRISWFPIRAW